MSCSRTPQHPFRLRRSHSYMVGSRIPVIGGGPPPLQCAALSLEGDPARGDICAAALTGSRVSVDSWSGMAVCR